MSHCYVRLHAARKVDHDLVRVARALALITSITSDVAEAAATTGHDYRDLMQELAPRLEANEVAWNRLAKRRGDTQASRTDPCVRRRGQLMLAAIAATATNRTR
jgi:hypothetical protein